MGTREGNAACVSMSARFLAARVRFIPVRGIARGVLLYLLALALFSSMDATTKRLVTALPLLEVMWARFTFHLLWVALLFWLSGRRLQVWPRAPGLQAIRSLTLAGSNLFFVAALTHAALAQVTAINFVAPLLTVILAALWLKERVGMTRWLAVVMGLAGVAIVLHPRPDNIHASAFWALGSATVYAFYHVFTRKLAGVDTPLTTIFHTALWAALLGSALVPLVWVPPPLWAWALMLLVGALGALSHFLLVLAYEWAPASILAPISYAQLIWASLFGLTLFGEWPDRYTSVGAAVIAAAGVFALSARTGNKPSEVKG